MNEFSAYFDVPTTDLRFVYSCPEGGGSVAIAVEGHDLVSAAPCDSDQVVIDRPGPGLVLEDGTRFEAGDMVELTMRRLAGEGTTETATDSDGTRLHVDILKRIDPRTPRVGELEVSSTRQESPDDVWELSEITTADPGARNFTIDVGPDVLGDGRRWVRVPFTVSAPDGGRTASTDRSSSTRSPASTARRCPVPAGGSRSGWTRSPSPTASSASSSTPAPTDPTSHPNRQPRRRASSCPPKCGFLRAEE